MIDDDSLARELRAAVSTAHPPLTKLATAAAEGGLLDVAYATLESPLGTLLLASTPRGLVRLAYVQDDEDQVLAELARRVSPRILAAPHRLDEPRRELEQYFAGERRRFELPIDWQLTRDFTRRVLRATASIPYGSVSSYKQIATAAGSPRGSRAAGNALGSNPVPIVVPCHRILHASGTIGGYTGGLERKRLLLALEGVRT